MCFYTLTVFICGHRMVSIHHDCPAASTDMNEKFCTLRPLTYLPATEDNTWCTRLMYDDAFCDECAQNGLPEAEGTAMVNHAPVQWDPRMQQEGTLRQISRFVGEKYQALRKDFQALALVYHRLKVSVREGDRVIPQTAALCQEVFGGSKSLPLNPNGNSREDWFSIWRQVEDSRDEAKPLIVLGEYDTAYAYLLSAIEALDKIKANLSVLSDHVMCVKSLHDSDAHTPGFLTPETLEETGLRKQILKNWLLTLPEILILPEVVWAMNQDGWGVYHGLYAVFGADTAAKAMTLDTDSDPDFEDEACDLALDDGEQYALPNGLANSMFPVIAPPNFTQ